MASVVGAVIFFLMLFTVGTGYFLFVNSNNLLYNQALSSRSQSGQSQVLVNLQISAWRASSGYLFLNITNTGGIGANITDVFISTPTGATPSNTVCAYGLGITSVVSGCPNPGSSPPVCPSVGGQSIVSTQPCLPLSLSAGATVLRITTGLAISTGTYTVKVVTQNGNTFTTTYPAPVPNIPLTALEAESAGGLTVNLASFRWFSLTAASSLNYWDYTNCASSHTCSLGFGSGNQVTEGDLLVLALGWSAQSTPPTITDSLSDSFTQLTQSPNGQVTYAPPTPNVALQAYSSNCASSSCSLGFGASSPVTAGDLLVLALGWSGQSAPSSSSITDSFSHDSFTQGAGYSVQGTSTPTVVVGSPQYYTPSLSSGSYSVSFTPATAGDTLVVTVGWSSSSSSCSPTVSDTSNDQFSADPDNTDVRTGSYPTYTYYYSQIWYATATSATAQTIKISSFGTCNSQSSGTVSVYELAGTSPATVQSGDYSSGTSTSSSTAEVASFTPSANSIVIGNAEISSAKFTSSQYTLVSSSCDPASGSVTGCSEYGNDNNVGTQVTMGLSSSVPYAEVAISFAPTTYYSYIWYATATSSGTDTITASFSSWVAGSVSIYELQGVAITGHTTSHNSNTGSSTATVSSFNPPSSNSIVIGNAVSSGAEFTAGSGSGYTLISNTCHTATVAGCSEYQTGVGATGQTVPMSLSSSVPWVESAMAFGPQSSITYYSYIWYALASQTATDTITATFCSTCTTSISESIYDLTGYSISNILTSYGSSASNSTSPSVGPFTPNSYSFVLGNVEAGSTFGSLPTYQAGTGYSLVSSYCSSYDVAGCSEYLPASGGVQTTVPFTLSVSVPWVESAAAFSSEPGPSSGAEVGGYPALGVPAGVTIVFEVTFTNNDPQQRSVSIWPQSALGLQSICSNQYWHNCAGGWYFEDIPFYIVDGLNSGYTGINAYSQPFVTLPYGVPVTLYFGANAPLSSSTNGLNNWAPEAPFEAMFTLLGQYSDGSLYGQTIPFPAGTVTGANAYTQPIFGSTNTPITVSCTPTGQYQQNSCNFLDNANLLVGWMNSAGKITTLTTSCSTNGQGDINSGCTFTVPSASPGFYTIIVSDYVNTVFMTFQHT